MSDKFLSADQIRDEQKKLRLNKVNESKETISLELQKRFKLALENERKVIELYPMRGIDLTANEIFKCVHDLLNGLGYDIDICHDPEEGGYVRISWFSEDEK
jgi:hypothetical protein